MTKLVTMDLNNRKPGLTKRCFWLQRACLQRPFPLRRLVPMRTDRNEPSVGSSSRIAAIRHVRIASWSIS